MPSRIERRTAISAEIAALIQDTRKRGAGDAEALSGFGYAGLTQIFAQYQTGVCGVVYAYDVLLMIVLIVDDFCILAFKFKSYSPVPIHFNAPVTF